MSNTPPDPSSPPGGPLSGPQGFAPSPPADPLTADDLVAAWDVPAEADPPVAEAVVGADGPEGIPLAMPVPLAEPIEGEDVPVALLAPDGPPPAAEPPPAAPTSITCPVCQSVNPLDHSFCSECGSYFSDADRASATSSHAPAPAGPPDPLPLLQGRYERREPLSERLGVERFRAIDRGDDARPNLEVVIVREKLPPPPPPPAGVIETDETVTEDVLPSFDDPDEGGFPATEVITNHPLWPSIAWERKLLRTLEHPSLPAEIDHFTDDVYEYLVEERPAGRSLWDAWDDPEVGAAERFGYLAELAEVLQRLHQCKAMLDGLRPDLVVLDEAGRVRLTELTDLLPIPVPPSSPIRGGLYTAPELLAGRGGDARAELYGFGAMLYALHVGRELNERTDFDGPGDPKPFIPRFPDVHPAFGRLMMKTFRKGVEARFPSDEASREDATGFSELIRTLEVLRRTHDNVRLEVASWTSTGIVRTGNEDAFAVLHACESRQDDLGEAALVILCDGMGGYEAGEVAAALTIQSLRQQLAAQWPFSVAAGASPFPGDPLAHGPHAQGHAPPRADLDAVQRAIKAALREANRVVFQASRAPGSKRRGMGCTAEVVYVDGRNVVVGHVGDSRTYHLHEGRLVQMTRDQTLVNRLVELGSLSEEEAETHPRRNELQQAIGGQPDVEPGVYHGKLTPGDWVVVCSDGLTNHVGARELKQMLQSEAGSAEVAARRLVNLTLIEGGTDNVTVVAIRAT